MTAFGASKYDYFFSLCAHSYLFSPRYPEEKVLIEPFLITPDGAWGWLEVRSKNGLQAVHKAIVADYVTLTILELTDTAEKVPTVLIQLLKPS